MKYLITLFFTASLFLNAVGNTKNSIQNDHSELFKFNSAKTGNPDAGVKDKVSDAIILNVDKDILNNIFSEKTYKLNLKIPVSGSDFVNAELERFDVLSDDAILISKGASGEIPFSSEGLILSYKGKVTGADESLISISIYDGKIIGLMKSKNETFVLGNLTDRNNRDTEDYILYRESNLKNRHGVKCGSDIFGVPDEIISRIQNLNGQPIDAGTATLLSSNIAVDVDFYTYGIYGNSVPNASAYALALMSAASAVYAKDMNIRLYVNYLRVWTVQDPYTSDDGGTLLDQFRFDWINTQGSVTRTVAHLISRRNSINVGGIAYVNVLCNNSFGYGLSSVQGNIGQLPNYSYDVVVVAHELGHNFGSPHTHSCSWVGGPIDSCYFTEGGCYNGPLIPTQSTIMSYCDTEGGTVIMDFGTQPEALIRNNAENAAGCFGTAPQVYTAFPNGGETFRTLTNTKIFWGTSVAGNVNIEFTTDNGGSWISIANNVPVQQREYDWTVPYIGYTNQAKVRILNSANLNEGDTSDAAFKIILTYNSMTSLNPPSLARIETNAQNTNLNRFDWTSAGAHPSFRYKVKFRKLGAGGVDYIFDADNNGTDTVLNIRNGVLDSIALLMGTVGDSVRCSWRAWAYNGYDSAQTSNSAILTLIRTTVGINQISSVLPEKFDLGNNYPNPFNPVTKIKFDVASAQQVKIIIYNNLGKKISELVNNKLQPGVYEVNFNGADMSSGVYFYTMETSDFVMTKKMLLIK
ncbi:MAG TPA: M12 family metallo-peptidase [Ignavibacteria bacterium]|nr:M12 family metallo-peptidase [Ignavibacteria bacterium]HRA99603.1 M12 family metallo-peptidase [Ignavibacteria bacterium]